jgi:hypothetical protein
LHVAKSNTFTKERNMAKQKVSAVPVKKTISGKLGEVVAKGQDFGKNVAAKARAAGMSAKAAGTRAAAHVSRNKAAYIAGGLGAAAGVAGMATASRKKQVQDEN